MLVVAALFATILGNADAFSTIERGGVRSMNTNQDLSRFVEQPSQLHVTACGALAERVWWDSYNKVQGGGVNGRSMAGSSLREGKAFDECMVNSGYTLVTK